MQFKWVPTTNTFYKGICCGYPFELHQLVNAIQTRSGSRWHAIANPHASGRNCPCTTQHSFKQPGKILLVCYSTHHSLQFDMPHDHVVRNLIFDPAPPHKSHPKGCSWGHKVNPVQYVLHLSLLSLCAHFRIKIFKITLKLEIVNIWPFDPSPGPLGAGPKINMLLHAPLV